MPNKPKQLCHMDHALVKLYNAPQGLRFSELFDQVNGPNQSAFFTIGSGSYFYPPHEVRVAPTPECPLGWLSYPTPKTFAVQHNGVWRVPKFWTKHDGRYFITPAGVERLTERQLI